MKFAEKNRFEYGITEIFLLEVDRLKTLGTMSDMDIMIKAYENVVEERSPRFGRRISRTR